MAFIGALISDNVDTSRNKNNEYHIDINEDDHDCRKYSEDDVKRIRRIYVVFAVIWIILIFLLQIPRKNFLILALLTVPIILALVAYNNAPHIEKTCEDLVLRTNTITVMIVAAAIVSQWKPFGGQDINKNQFYKLLTAAFVILLLSVLDVWVPDCDRTVIIHVKVSLQGIAIVILIIAVYSFFLEVSGKVGY
uniref:Transmembrane protein n=1 Tax=Pithovirus LCPAC406 TaxID=2506599 RepID=A0A481ZDA9_9VIRU|nr:MAG: hypothetical protein LCPAC406_02570 [Pithovirus LCPAC406]